MESWQSTNGTHEVRTAWEELLHTVPYVELTIPNKLASGANYGLNPVIIRLSELCVEYKGSLRCGELRAHDTEATFAASNPFFADQIIGADLEAKDYKFRVAKIKEGTRAELPEDGLRYAVPFTLCRAIHPGSCLQSRIPMTHFIEQTCDRASMLGTSVEHMRRKFPLKVCVEFRERLEVCIAQCNL